MMLVDGLESHRANMDFLSILVNDYISFQTS